MADPLPSTTTAGFTTAIATPADDFDHRWAAWQARSAAHDRRVGRRMATALPILLVAAILMLWLLAR